MIILVISLILLLISFTALFINIYQDRLWNRTIAFDEDYYKSNALILKCNQDGNPINFIIDTGSSVSAIDRCVIDKFYNIEKDDTTTVIGVDGVTEKVKLYEIRFKFKETDYYHTFVAKNLKKAFKPIEEKTGLVIHGILGTDFLEKNNFIINYNAHLIHV